MTTGTTVPTMGGTTSQLIQPANSKTGSIKKIQGDFRSVLIIVNIA
jgi:hypothetical protein